MISNNKSNTHNNNNKVIIDHNTLGGKKWIILHLKCLSLHPEMWGKYWITIIRNHSFHKSLHSVGCSLLFWTARAVTVTLSVLCSIKHVLNTISLGSENSSKNGLLSCHSSNQCSNYTVDLGEPTFFIIYFYNGGGGVGGGVVCLQWLTKIHNYKCMHYLHYIG